MILPNREKAYIPTPKLYDYLLSTSHTAGKGKAKFFRGFGLLKQVRMNQDLLLFIPVLNN